MRGVILFVFCFLSFNVVKACKCSKSDSLKAEYETTDQIVYGKVSKLDIIYLKEIYTDEERNQILKNNPRNTDEIFEIPIRRIELTVCRKFKGDNIRDKVTVYTALHSASCGFGFQEGQEYIVFMSFKSYLYFLFDSPIQKNTFWTSHCTWTSEYDNNLERQLLMI